MIDELQLFRGKDYKINDKITIHQPTLDEICNYGEQKYWSVVSMLTSNPSDYKVQLDDAGIDYETISDLDFFFMLCHDLSIDDTRIFLYDLDLSTFDSAINKQNDETVYYSEYHDVIIDTNIHRIISDYIRTIHYIPKKIDKAGNEHTKKYLIETERRKLKRQKKQKFKSMLIPSISAMTNCEQFKYSHDTVWKLHIYTFYDSIKRIQKIKSTDNLYIGIYTGNVDAKKISEEELNWLGSLDK